jgi:DNA-binding transcriptional regulator GbsR (MarR family)
MRWIYKIVIADITKPYRDRDVTDEEAKQIGKRVAERIRQSEAYHHFKTELEEIANKFEEQVTSQEDFNEVLDELYDVADSHSIWVDNLPTT